MNNTPNEFDEFFSLINTTSDRRLNAFQMKTKGYIPLASDAKPRSPRSPKYKPKRKHKPDIWDDKIKAYNDKIADRGKHPQPE